MTSVVQFCAPFLLTSLGLLSAGCGDDPPAAAPGAVLSTGSAPRVLSARVAPPPGLVGADAADDPSAPAALPATGTVGDWVKVRAVRMALGADLAALGIDARQAARWRPYRIKQAATVEYARLTRWGTQTASVQLVETYSPEDAFGLYSIEGVASGVPVGDGEIRISRPGGYALHAYNGRYSVHLSGRFAADAGAQADGRQACEQLMAQIRTGLPAAQPPAELSRFPQIGAVTPKRWIARSTTSLAGPSRALIPIADPAKIDALLGLTPDTLLVVATYAVPGAGGTDTLWLVQYETEADARAASRRYRAFVDNASDADAADAMVTEAIGRYVLGTWTAQAESVAHFLPQIRHRLRS